MNAGLLRSLALVGLILAPLPAAADCYADYKAKKDDPLRLHYGVIALPDAACADRAAAAEAVAGRIAGDGWTLLSVVSLFGEEGLAERRAEAGGNFLRY
ncbi:hypothetical protein ACQ5SP_15490 [Rhodovulum sp. YNF3179]|uniref:hypothetical protein n=1 Tax=Rhodovulum sp. YNF3179 TaxID=3425127 RepID=UPI003D34FD5B